MLSIENLYVPTLNTRLPFSFKNATYADIQVNVVTRNCQTVLVGSTRDTTDATYCF